MGAWRMMRCRLSIGNSCTRGINTVGRLHRHWFVQWSSNAGDLHPSKEGSDLIQVQKDRATARWKEAFQKNYFDDQKIFDQVLEQLSDGKVPPIYHTLCRDPAKRLFLPNTVVSDGKKHSGIIEISTSFVKAGNSRRRSKMSTDVAIWENEDFSYLKAFFTKGGHHLTNVWDDVVKENWEFNEEVTSCVTDLVNTPAVMVGLDLEVTALPNEFPLDFFNGRNLITRSLSRGVVGDCFVHSKPGSIHSIIGVPGIGKSWNLIYALQQALLFENVCVMFFFQKKGRAWVCIRKKNQIYAWSITSGSLETKCNSGLFNNGNVLVLLDPKEAPSGGASFIVERQQLIFAASNEAAHFKNFYKDSSNGLDYERILNPYSTLELKTALKFMSKSDVPYSDDDVVPMLAYAEQVGNKPRYVMSKVRFQLVLKKINKFLHGINRMDAEMLLKFLCFSGTVGVEEQDFIDGAVYSLYAKGSIYSDFSLVDVGYDGDAMVDGRPVVDYGRRIVEFTSNYIRVQLAIAQRAALLSYDGKTADWLGSLFRHIIEELFWMDMEKNIKMKVYEMKPIEMKTNQGKEPYMVDFLFEGAAYYGRRTRLMELATTFLNNNGNKYKFRMTANDFALFQFAAFRPPCLFQVTMSEDRSVSRQSVKDLFIACGILEEHNEVLSYSEWAQKDLENPILLQQWKLKFYWVVPEGVSNRWIDRKPLDLDSIFEEISEEENGINANNEEKKKEKVKKTDILDDAWMKCVDQYVAVMSPHLVYDKSELSDISSLPSRTNELSNEQKTGNDV